MDIQASHNLELYRVVPVNHRGSFGAYGPENLLIGERQFVPETYAPVLYKRKAQRWAPPSLLIEIP